MRITLLLLAAAGLSLSAGGAAAAAEIARGSMVRSVSPHGAWKPGGLGPGFKDWRPHRPHPGRDHWRHDRRDRHRGHHWGAEPGLAYSFGGGGIAYPFEVMDRHGNGFFAGGGGEIRLQGGRPHYDYDRSYPYEWAPSGSAGRPRAEEEADPISPVQCGFERGVRVCRGGR